MSIRDQIHALLDEGDGRLVLVEPMLPLNQHRVIYATKELHDEIAAGGMRAGDATAHRIGLLRSDLDWFSAGELITVGYRTEDACRMKPLEPQSDEVWELRSRDPRPSIRIFGRFAEPDVFIATHMARRDELGGWGSLEWAAEIRRCKAIWRRLFLTYPPHSGDHIHDYITTNVIEIGDLP